MTLRKKNSSVLPDEIDKVGTRFPHIDRLTVNS